MLSGMWPAIKANSQEMNFIYDTLTIIVPLAIGVLFVTKAKQLQRWAIKVRERENVRLFDNYVRWFDVKYGQDEDWHDWIKMHLMVGTSTHIVTSVELGRSSSDRTRGLSL